MVDTNTPGITIQFDPRQIKEQIAIAKMKREDEERRYGEAIRRLKQRGQDLDNWWNEGQLVKSTELAFASQDLEKAKEALEEQQRLTHLIHLLEGLIP